MLISDHQVVSTPQIYDEWKRHWSRFFIRWLRGMTARKKAFRLEPPSLDVREALLRVGLTEVRRQAAEKDLHLLEAAQPADRIVCSLDAAALGIFTLLARELVWVGLIAWVNPETETDAGESRLKSGAALKDRLIRD